MYLTQFISLSIFQHNFASILVAFHLTQWIHYREIFGFIELLESRGIATNLGTRLKHTKNLETKCEEINYIHVKFS